MLVPAAELLEAIIRGGGLRGGLHHLTVDAANRAAGRSACGIAVARRNLIFAGDEVDGPLLVCVAEDLSGDGGSEKTRERDHSERRSEQHRSDIGWTWHTA